MNPTEAGWTKAVQAKLQSCQFFGNLLVEDFFDGEGDDDFVAAFEKRFDFAQGLILADGKPV